MQSYKFDLNNMKFIENFKLKSIAMVTEFNNTIFLKGLRSIMQETIYHTYTKSLLKKN